MSGRIIPGTGEAIRSELVANAVAANYDPVATNKAQELTFAGAPQSITTAEHEGTVTAAGNPGDTAVLTLNGVAYQAMQTGALTAALLATELAAAATLGSQDTWTSTIAGGPAIGGEACGVTIGATSYPYVAIARDTAAQVAAGIAAAAAGDPDYTVTNPAGALLVVTKNVRGAGVAVSFQTDGVVFTSTDAHVVTGVAGQADWTVIAPGAGVVNATNAAPGATTDTAAGSSTGAIVFTCPSVQVGYDADNAIAFDGLLTSWQHTVQLGDTPGIIAAAMKVLIDGSGGYVASVLGDVVTVTRTDYATFAFADQSTTPNPASTLTITPATTIPLHAPLTGADGVATSGSVLASGTLECLLNAGVSYDVEVWSYDSTLAQWLKDLTFGTKTIVASGVHTVALNGSRAFAFVDNFVGGADATVIFRTNR